MQLLKFAVIHATIIQFCFGVLNQFPEQSKQIISSTVETPCFINSAFEPNKFVYPISSITNDAENSNSFTLTGWFKSKGYQLQGQSILFYLVKNLKSTTQSDLIFYLGFNEGANWQLIYGNYQNSLIQYSQTINQNINRKKWYFLSISFQILPSNQMILSILMKQPNNPSAATQIQQFNIQNNYNPFQLIFSDKTFLVQGGIVMSSQPLFSSPSSFNPSCTQMKNVQVHWNYIFNDANTDYSFSEPLVSKFAAKLVYYFTMEGQDLFQQDSYTYLRNRSGQDGNHLIIDNSQAQIVTTFVEFTKQKVLPTFYVNDGFMISYWINLNQIQSGVAMVTATIILGDNQTSLQISHVQTGGQWQVKINSYTFTHNKLNSDWDFFLFQFDGSQFQTKPKIIMQSLDSSYKVVQTSQDATQKELDYLFINGYDQIKITMGSTNTNQSIKLRDLKIFKDVSIFQYDFEGFSSNCQLVYGLETKQCLLCKPNYRMTNDGICIKKCVLNPSNSELKSDYFTSFSKCLTCSTGQTQIMNSYDNQCREIQKIFDPSQSQTVTIGSSYTINLQKKYLIVVTSSLPKIDVDVVLTNINSGQITINQTPSSPSLSLKIHYFDKLDKISSGVNKITATSVQYIKFDVLFRTSPKVIVSLIGFKFASNTKITQTLKKVSTEGFYISYDSDVTISWLAISNCLEVLQANYNSGGTKSIFQNSFGQINQLQSAQYIFAMNQITSTQTSITIPSNPQIFNANNKFIYDQSSSYPSLTDFAGYDIGIFFELSNSDQNCNSNTNLVIPFSQINAIFSQNKNTPQIINFRTPKPTSDYQILFSLMNFKYSSGKFSFEQRPRYISYSYSLSNTQSDFYYFTIRHPSIIVTQIFTVSVTSINKFYTFQLQNSLPSSNVQIKGSILYWSKIGTILKLGDNAQNIQQSSFQYSIDSTDDGDLQIQFIIFTNSFSFSNVQTKSQTTTSFVLKEGTIFGVQSIQSSNNFQVQLSNNQITFSNTITALWSLDGVTIDSTRKDSCNLLRNEDFKCDQCQNQLLYGNYKDKLCTCPPGFGYDYKNSVCARCSVGCLYCVFQNDSTISECQLCDTDSNFTLSQSTCICNPNYYQDDKDSNFCIPTIDAGNPLSLAVVNIPIAKKINISSLATLTTNMISTQTQMTLGCWVKIDKTNTNSIDSISYTKTLDGTQIILVKYSNTIINVSSGLTGANPSSYAFLISTDDYVSQAINDGQYIYIGVSLDQSKQKAYLAIYAPGREYWVYKDDILSVIITTFTDSSMEFKDTNISEATFILGTTISAQKQSFVYHVRRQNNPIYFFSVADAGMDLTKQIYTVKQNQNIIFYYPGKYQYLLPSADSYLKFPDSMKDSILSINYQILGYAVKADQQLMPNSLPQAPSQISTNFVISFWVRGLAIVKQDEDVILAQVENLLIIGHYQSNGLAVRVTVCISRECQTIKKWLLDNNSWNQLSFIVENEDLNYFIHRPGTLVRAFYKTLEERLYFDSIPKQPTSNSNLGLGSIFNTKSNQGFWYNFYTILNGNFYKYKNVDDTVELKYCSLNAGKYYSYCLKCSYQNPRTDHLCSQLPSDSSCTSPENLSQITQTFIDPSYTYQGRDPYLYYSNYDVCERCVTSRCSQCQTTIDNCVQQCSNQCEKCVLSQPWTCNKCRGNRSNEPSCSTCPNYTADDYVSENCVCSNACKACPTSGTGSSSDCGCNNQVDMCNSCAADSFRSFIPLCQCQFGYFDSGNSVCQKCDVKCTRCQNTSTNCIQCQGNRINPPSCTCPDYTYDDGSSICKNCPTDCVQCAKQENSTTLKCLQCRYNSSWNGSACICNDGFYDNQQVDNCTECDMLCKTCERSGQCTSCIGKRVLDSTGQCVCPDGYYGKPYIQQCESCYKTCRTCFGQGENQCIECYQDPYVRLRQGKCVCANGDFFFNFNLKQCVLYTTFTDDLYYDVDIMPVLSLNFTNSLSSSALNVMENMSFKIEGLTYNKDFTTSVFYQNQGRIDIKINLSVSFRPTTLTVTVLNADSVKDSQQTPLNRKYFGYSMVFNLYPHHDVGKDRLNYLMNMRKFSTSVYEREGFGIDFVWLLQLLAAQNFLFSAMQPTSMILMYNQYLPINVYETLRAFSILQYQQCPVWGEFGYEDTMIFRKSSESITDTQIPNVNMRRFGYSSSFFINFLRQIFLYGFLWFVFYLVKLRFLNEKYTQVKNKKIPWLESFYNLFVYFMSKLTEAFFITLTIVIFMQIKDPSFSNAFNGISYLLNFIYMGGIGGVFYFFFDQVRNHDISEIEQKYIACRSLGNLLIDLNTSNDILTKYYHMITYFKKLFYSIIIIFAFNLEENHTIPLIIIEVIFLIFFIIIRPLSSPLYNIIRILINSLYIGILIFVFLLGRKWVSITKDQVIIEASSAESYYSQGNLLLVLILIYNIINFIFASYVAAIHFYHDYIQYKNEKIKEEAFDNLYNKKLFNYQELQDFEISQRRDSVMKIIDLDDKRNVGPLPIKEIESEILKDSPLTDEAMLAMQTENNNKRKNGFYHIILRKDIIWRNYIDPINKSFTIAVETVETFGAKRQPNPIINNIETNIVVDYSNIQKIVYKSGQEEFRILSDLLSKWRIQKHTRVQRELSCVVDLSKYKFGDTINLNDPVRKVDYFLSVTKSKQLF